MARACRRYGQASASSADTGTRSTFSEVDWRLQPSYSRHLGGLAGNEVAPGSYDFGLGRWDRCSLGWRGGGVCPVALTSEPQGLHGSWGEPPVSRQAGM